MAGGGLYLPMAVGLLKIRDYDEAVYRSLCAKLDTGDNQYYVVIRGLKSASGVIEPARVPVFFSVASQADIFPKFRVPAFIVRRNGIGFATDRWTVPDERAYREPSSGAHEITVDGVTGYDSYDEMTSFAPVDFSYSIQAIARYTTDANALIQHLFGRLRSPWSNIWVLDSLGQEHGFGFTLGDVSDISNLVDIAEKLVGVDMSLTVEGELPVTGVREGVVSVSKRVVTRFVPKTDGIPLS